MRKMRLTIVSSVVVGIAVTAYGWQKSFQSSSRNNDSPKGAGALLPPSDLDRHCFRIVQSLKGIENPYAAHKAGWHWAQEFGEQRFVSVIGRDGALACSIIVKIPRSTNVQSSNLGLGAFGSKWWKCGPFIPGCGSGLSDEELGHYADAYQIRTIYFPFWSLFVCLCVYPAVVLGILPIRRMQRRRKGCCADCGYNLKGASGRYCSECGNGFASEARAFLD